MVKTVLYIAAAGLFSCSGISSHSAPPLEVVPRVDLKRYVGEWHEIARIPTWFQRGCTASTATYTLRDDGTIGVLNRCRRGPGGEIDSAEGRAWVVDPVTNAKLEVQFFWPFRGDYWIISLGPDYDYAVVGHPSREYLWILSRTRSMDDALYTRILKRLQEQGYDTGRLVRSSPES